MGNLLANSNSSNWSHIDMNDVIFDPLNVHSTLKKTADDPNEEVRLFVTEVMSNKISYEVIETLVKNNSMMKEQLRAFVDLKDQMISKIQQLQQNLQEEKKERFSLEKENRKLQRKLDSLPKDMRHSKEINKCSKEESVKESSLISYDTCKELADHKKVIKEKDEEDRSNGGKPIVCPACGNEFPNRLAANNHMNHYHIMS